MDALEQPDDEVTTEIEASPDAVWSVVSDPTRTPEFSPVVVRSEWVGPPAEPVKGARFRGHNRFQMVRWTRDCEVTAAEPGRLFAFSTLDASGGEQTRWRYRIEPSPAGSRVSLGYQSITMPWYVSALRRLGPTRRMSEKQGHQNLVDSLERLRAVVT